MMLAPVQKKASVSCSLPKIEETGQGQEQDEQSERHGHGGLQERRKSLCADNEDH